ncbi:MAG: tetratricopeptide repeat protein [Vampirovibrionales bacterium]|nr:tetratricopeptide repeat protein [Vampirovibrionales bacterium]
MDSSLVIIIGAVIGGAVVLAGLLAISRTEVKASSPGVSAKDILMDDEEEDEEASLNAALVKLITEGNAGEQRYDFTTAIEKFDDALKLEPSNPTLLYKLGKAHSQKGNLEKARQCLEKASALAPQQPKMQLVLAKVHMGLGDISAAKEATEKALSIDPRNEIALKMKALVYGQDPASTEGVDAIEDLMVSYPQNPQYKKQYLSALKQRRQWTEALEFCQRLINEDPANAVDYMIEQAHVYVEAGDYPNGLAKFQELVNNHSHEVLESRAGLKETYAACLCNQGVALQTQGQREQALTLYREALNVDDQNADIHYNYGKALMDNDDLSGAVEKFETALKLNAKDADSAYELGRIHDRRNNLEEAMGYYQQALDLSPLMGRAAFAIGTLYGVKESYSEAMNWLSKALKLDPGNVDTLYNLAVATERSGEKNKAVQLYRKVLELDARHQDAKNNLASLKKELQRA